MRAKKIFAVACAVCVSLALGTGVFAQDDLDNLLNDLEGDVKKKPAEAKPAAPAHHGRQEQQHAGPPDPDGSAPSAADQCLILQSTAVPVCGMK